MMLKWMQLTRTLCDANKDVILKIKRIIAGFRARNYLSDLGIIEDEKIKILKNDEGPVIVEIKGTRVAIGRGLAAKIEVISEN